MTLLCLWATVSFFTGAALFGAIGFAAGQASRPLTPAEVDAIANEWGIGYAAGHAGGSLTAAELDAVTKTHGRGNH